MPEPVLFKYRAFLSYSHADMSWAKWLHSRLEGCRIDKDLVGRETKMGPVPKALRPIFRDREDFAGGHMLTDATITALDNSAALIVLCSTISAQRPAVNEEVRLFKSRHPNRPIIPVIIEGTPPENFPAALRYELASDGSVTDRPVTVLAPDVRENRDGKSLALAKVIAGVTGLATDEIVRRAERDRRRTLRNWIAGLSLIALTLAGLTVWAELNRRDAVTHRAIAERNFTAAKQGADALVVDIAQGLRDVEGMRTDSLRRILGKAEEIFDTLVKSAGENKELLRSQARMLGEFAETYAAQGDTTKQVDAAKKTLAIMERLAKANSGNTEWQSGLSVSHEKFGNALVSQGNLLGGLDNYRASLAIMERLTRENPENAEWQHDFSVVQERIGEVFRAQGKLAAALDAFRASRAIIERLAKAHPTNGARQRELSVWHSVIGDILFDQGDRPAALASYQAALAIIESLANAAPEIAGWQRDFAQTQDRIGKVLLAQGDLPAALDSYQASLAIMEGLTKADPGNATWLSDLSHSHVNVGDVLLTIFNTGSQLSPVARVERYREGIKNYRAALTIEEGLVKADPGNAKWQHRLSVSQSRIGDDHVARGNLPAALETYLASHAIIEHLVKADPTNSVRKADLAASHGNIGRLLVRMDRRDEALRSFKSGRDIVAPLVAASPNSSLWKQYHANFERDISRLER